MYCCCQSLGWITCVCFFLVSTALISISVNYVTCCQDGWNPKGWIPGCPESGRSCQHPKKKSQKYYYQNYFKADICSSYSVAKSQHISSFPQQVKASHPLHFFFAADSIVVAKGSIRLRKTTWNDERHTYMYLNRNGNGNGETKIQKLGKSEKEKRWKSKMKRHRIRLFSSTTTKKKKRTEVRWKCRTSSKSSSCRLGGLLARSEWSNFFFHLTHLKTSPKNHLWWWESVLEARKWTLASVGDYLVTQSCEKILHFLLHFHWIMTVCD